MIPKMKRYKSYSGWKSDQSSSNQALINELEKLLLAINPDFDLSVKWGQGCFAIDGQHKVYIHAAKDYVQLGFYKGAQLDDPSSILRGNGQYVRHIPIINIRDIDDNNEAIINIIAQII